MNSRLLNIFYLLLIGLMTPNNLLAQNLELITGREMQQPGKINPALVGVQEEFFRILSKAELGQNYQFMVEGRVPLFKGSYLVGLERLNSEHVNNNIFNVAYSRKIKTKNELRWRYGANVKYNQKTLASTDFDSSKGFSFIDLDGKRYTMAKLSDGETQRNFADIELGVNLDYKGLFAGLSIENVAGSNVSHIQGAQRKVPFTGNLVIGGFLKSGENWSFLPNAVLVVNEDDLFIKSGLDVSFKTLNFAAKYTLINSDQYGEAMIGMKGTKMLGGIRASYRLVEENVSNNSPLLLELFFNTSLFKKRDWLRSEFAKRMRKFY